MEVHLAVTWLDPASLVSAFGLIGVILIVFAETGLLIEFVFPGDSLPSRQPSLRELTVRPSCAKDIVQCDRGQVAASNQVKDVAIQVSDCAMIRVA